MDKPDNIIAEKSVSALLDNARMARLGKMILGMDGQISAALSKKMIGGQWIIGKAYLTPDAFEFHPSLLNRPFMKNMDELCVRMKWSDITDIRKRFGVVGAIIDFDTADQTCSIRCQGAPAFMAKIETARGG